MKISKGLNLPISNSPINQIKDFTTDNIAVSGLDFKDIKPRFCVEEKDNFSKGDLLFSDSKNESLKYYAIASGTVVKINRGTKRKFLSIQLKYSDNNFKINQAHLFEGKNLTKKEDIAQILSQTNLWLSLRTRPFDKIPQFNEKPHSIFINAMSTEPLAPNYNLIVEGQEKNIEKGIEILSYFTDNKIYLNKSPQLKLKLDAKNNNTVVTDFEGKHPAGLVGTHIHFLDPVSLEKTVWHIDMQDVIAIGQLFNEQILNEKRIISLAGPEVKEPKHYRVPIGSFLKDLTHTKLNVQKPVRIISGSVLTGRFANSEDGLCYLGRYHNIVSCIEESVSRVFMGWLSPGFNKHSKKGIYFSSFFKPKKMKFDTSTNGSERAIVPIGSYEEVMPLDILPTPLLRYLIVEDYMMAIKLGALELAEEDVALMTYVSPEKYEYGEILRNNLRLIEREFK